MEICAQIISPDDIGSLEFALQIVASDDTPTEGDIASKASKGSSQTICMIFLYHKAR